MLWLNFPDFTFLLHIKLRIVVDTSDQSVNFALTHNRTASARLCFTSAASSSCGRRSTPS